MDNQKLVQNLPVPGRFIRFRNAAHYLGMNNRLFNQIVRPYIKEIPIGIRGIAFDKLDLDQWADHYKSRNGRPKAAQPTGEQQWDEKERQASINVKASGILIRRYKAGDFAKAVERIISKKRKNT